MMRVKWRRNKRFTVPFTPNKAIPVSEGFYKVVTAETNKMKAAQVRMGSRNWPLDYARAAFVGTLAEKIKHWVKPDGFKIFQAVLEVKNHDIGQTSRKARITIYGTSDAHRILKHSRIGDRLIIMEAKWAWFCDPSVAAEKDWHNGWVTSHITNWTASMVSRWGGAQKEANAEYTEKVAGIAEHDELPKETRELTKGLPF